MDYLPTPTRIKHQNMDDIPTPTKSQIQNPEWIPINQPSKQDINYDPREIREEYFCAEDPRFTWKYGFVGTILSALLCMAIFEKETYLNMFKWYIITWLCIFIFMILFDHYLLLWASSKPEFTNQTTFSFKNRIYKVLNPPLSKEEEKKHPNGVGISRNMIKYKVTTWAETLWYTRNVSVNLALVDYSRCFQFALYFFKDFLGIINHKYIHTKTTFFFIINSALSAYVREHKEEKQNPVTGKIENIDVTTLQFNKIRLPVNNYGILAKIWKLNLKYRDFDVKIYLDVENEIVSEMQITLLDLDPNDKNQDPDFGKNYQKTTILRPNSEKERYEIHTFLLVVNTFVTHVHSHIMSAFCTDLDEIDFPKRKYAGAAISGLNTAGLYITSLVTGPICVPIILNNINLGYPHYPVVENRVLQTKSYQYLIMRKIFDDKDLVRICNQKKYKEKFIREYNEEREKLLKEDSSKKIPEYDPRFEISRSKLLRSSIASNFALHGIDHYIHDRFAPIYSYCDYLQYNDVRQHFFGGKWNCDITSNFQKPCGPISEIVYKIVKTWGGKELYKGFQWTLEQ